MLLGRALAMLVAVPAASCGSDTLSKQQYVSRLNAMCEAFSAKEKKIGEPRTIADLVENGPQILAEFEKAIVDKAHDLQAPDEIADQAERLVDLADRQRSVLADLIDAAKENDLAKVQGLVSKNVALNEEAGSIARELGARACAE